AVSGQPEEDACDPDHGEEDERVAERGDLEHRPVEERRAQRGAQAEHAFVEGLRRAGHDQVREGGEEEPGRRADAETDREEGDDGAPEPADVPGDEAQFAVEPIAQEPQAAAGPPTSFGGAGRHTTARWQAGCMPRQGTMIELRNVTRIYAAAPGRGRVDTTALDDVTLAIPPGGVWGVVGPNGAGKTTLFGLILGFLHPTEGSVRIDGLEPRRYLRRHGAAYLPERFRLPPEWPVGDALRALAGL